MPEFAPHEILWDDEKAQRLWNYYGSSEAHRSTYFGETVGDHFVRVLKRNGLFRNATAIVDFSCGTGAIIQSIVKSVPHGVTVRGYDPSVRSITRANERNAGLRGFAGAFQISAYPTDLSDASVDLLILTEVIEHLDDTSLDAVMSECYRVLVPNGTIVATTPNNETLAASNVMCPECGCIFHRWQHLRSWTEQSARDLLTRFRFHNVKAKRITWGNELIDFAFLLLGREKTGLMITGRKSAN